MPDAFPSPWPGADDPPAAAAANFAADSLPPDTPGDALRPLPLHGLSPAVRGRGVSSAGATPARPHVWAPSPAVAVATATATPVLPAPPPPFAGAVSASPDARTPHLQHPGHQRHVGQPGSGVSPFCRGECLTHVASSPLFDADDAPPPPAVVRPSPPKRARDRTWAADDSVVLVEVRNDDGEYEDDAADDPPLRRRPRVVVSVASSGRPSSSSGRSSTTASSSSAAAAPAAASSPPGSASGRAVTVIDTAKDPHRRHRSSPHRHDDDNDYDDDGEVVPASPPPRARDGDGPSLLVRATMRTYGRQRWTRVSAGPPGGRGGGAGVWMNNGRIEVYDDDEEVIGPTQDS
ncbi:hypothetical protein HK405_016086 [Cladochytrium tenue]|nr:hypothetical protein HK405_016086 [Cladochytrium tenue]